MHVKPTSNEQWATCEGDANSCQKVKGLMFRLPLSVMAVMARFGMDRIPRSDQSGLSSILRHYLSYWESQGRGRLVGGCLWGRRVGPDWSDLAAAAAGSRIFLLPGSTYQMINLEMSPRRDNLLNIYHHSNTVKQCWVTLKTLKHSGSFSLAMDC